MAPTSTIRRRPRSTDLPNFHRRLTTRETQVWGPPTCSEIPTHARWSRGRLIYHGPMRQAGVETMSRILSAAKTEFAEHGLAGTRINRIAASARASKDRLYSYFDSKEDLYAEVLRKWMTTTAETTALAEDDVLGYVGRLFDDYAANPENARLQQWAQLEITESLEANDPRIVASRHAVGRIRAAQSAGYVDTSWDAAELLSMLNTIARILALPERHPYIASAIRPVDERREAALEAARRLIRTGD